MINEAIRGKGGSLKKTRNNNKILKHMKTSTYVCSNNDKNKYL